MLTSIKQSNKTARDNRAIKLGWKNGQELIDFLLVEISQGRESEVFVGKVGASIGKTPAKKTSGKTASSKVEKTTIHVVDVLDASGSMEGSKYNAAVKGINVGVKSLKEDKADVNYSYTLCDFSEDIIFRSTTDSLKNVKEFNGETRGSTSLYDAIGGSIKIIKEVKKSTDKVLINIYTDGQENSSRKYTGAQIASSIKELSEQGWTFTFIGTKMDVEYAQRHLKFDISNTLVHDNTGSGMEKAFLTNNLSRSSYSAKVEAGEDVSKGFYKDIN